MNMISHNERLVNWYYVFLGSYDKEQNLTLGICIWLFIQTSNYILVKDFLLN